VGTKIQLGRARRANINETRANLKSPRFDLKVTRFDPKTPLKIGIFNKNIKEKQYDDIKKIAKITFH
jgi:hypothetical protein